MKYSFAFKQKPLKPVIIGHETAAEEKELKKVEKQAKFFGKAYTFAAAAGFITAGLTVFATVGAEVFVPGSTREIPAGLVQGVLMASGGTGFLGLGGIFTHADALNEKKRQLESQIAHKPSSKLYEAVSQAGQEITEAGTVPATGRMGFNPGV